MVKKRVTTILIAATILVLGACSNDTDSKSDSKGGMDHGNMNHSSTGEVPEGLKIAESPTYEVGEKATLEADHMEGMKGAEATIVGAYDTTVYAVSYDPTTGGKRVENHEWVIHEELKEAGEEPFAVGAEVTLETEHMKGMKGATAVVDSAEQTTVYMIDYTPTNDGEEVKNHKWVTGNELSAQK
ncbi:YdhK family protein [Bacillus sp. DJP31]|uniref:YdhK family protein n=1 Tax=Bacillus sp. DJP31 TaxID=3409789 RepID=UPI003BB522BB